MGGSSPRWNSYASKIMSCTPVIWSENGLTFTRYFNNVVRNELVLGQFTTVMHFDGVPTKDDRRESFVTAQRTWLDVPLDFSKVLTRDEIILHRTELEIKYNSKTNGHARKCNSRNFYNEFTTIVFRLSETEELSFEFSSNGTSEFIPFCLISYRENGFEEFQWSVTVRDPTLDSTFHTRNVLCIDA